MGVEQVEAAPSIRDPDTGVRMFCRGCFFKSLQKTLEKRSVVVVIVLLCDRGNASVCSGVECLVVVVVVGRGKVFHGQAQAQERHALARAS